MKNEFKLGDILRFNAFTGPQADQMERLYNDELKAGDLVKVTELFPHNSSEPYIHFDGARYWHPEINFDLVSGGMPDMITVILRRKGDEKPVLKALENLGFIWRGGQAASRWSPWNRGGRVINIHVQLLNLAGSSYSGRQGLKPKEIEKNILNGDWHTYENVIFLNTKPSVKLVISDLTTILT